MSSSESDVFSTSRLPRASTRRIQAVGCPPSPPTASAVQPPVTVPGRKSPDGGSKDGLSWGSILPAPFTSLGELGAGSQGGCTSAPVETPARGPLEHPSPAGRQGAETPQHFPPHRSVSGGSPAPLPAPCGHGGCAHPGLSAATLPRRPAHLQWLSRRDTQGCPSREFLQEARHDMNAPHAHREPDHGQGQCHQLTGVLLASRDCAHPSRTHPPSQPLRWAGFTSLQV